MAYYGNKDTGEVNPSNFATRPGIIVGNGPVPQSDYLFGANMGLTHLENNLNISKSVIKTRFPYPVILRGSIIETAKANPVRSLLVLALTAITSKYVMEELY